MRFLDYARNDKKRGALEMTKETGCLIKFRRPVLVQKNPHHFTVTEEYFKIF